MLKKVAVGGTFDRLHRGHEALLNKAFEVGEFVVIGLTSDEMVEKEVEPFEVRKKRLEEFLKDRSKYEIVKLSDAYGTAASDGTIEGLVVSEETKRMGEEINASRIKKGFKPLKIIVVKHVMAEDGRPISSTRIRRGEIDRRGRVL